MVKVGIGKTCRQKGLVHIRFIGNTYFHPIQKGTTIFPRIKTFLLTDFINNTQHQLILMHQCYADCINRNSLHEIGGTVKRIDNPVKSISALCVCTLLGNKSGIRNDKRQTVNDHFFRFTIDITHQIVQTFILNH
ncbi:hypothetical protein SDC9_127290 [bioreactor metagenome]|uniref:Uncharacterized protein n=1 Tax=bioreactor metagenome TaxID=1076179 RepID=A0A645CTJ5_9ZZZZ